MEFTDGTPEDFKQMVLRIEAISQPYIEKIKAEPWNIDTLNAEMHEKASAIAWEYELRKYLPDCS